MTYAHTLSHRNSTDAVALVRPLLSPRGTVEEQPGGRTLVVRDVRASMSRIAPTLRDFDRPPQDLRFEIRLVRAGERRGLISPPEPEGEAIEAVLPAEVVDRLRGLLRYDDYRVLAHAGLSTREGEEVVYSLGDRYDVRFRPGTVMGGKRLRLEGFRIVEKPQRSTDKTRRLESRDVFHATLNLWLDKPLVVLAPDEGSRDEALMIAISCRPEPASDPER